MQQILLVGANGQVGQELQSTLAPLGTVTSVDRNTIDITVAERVQQLVSELQPQVIVNAAAYTAVDKAENEPEQAMLINGTATGTLAEQAKAVGAKLIHISTDYVFDGSKSQPYLESDSPSPLGVYGVSKLAGEKAVQEVDGVYSIVRTAWVYGALGKGNFVKTMLRLGADREEVRVVMDQVGSPTWAKDLATAIAQMIPRLTSETKGIYHYTNSGVISWYDFAVAIFEEARSLHFPLKIQRVTPITTADYPTPARRPPYSVLSPVKTAGLLGAHSPYWRDSLRQMLVELRDQGQ